MTKDISALTPGIVIGTAASVISVAPSAGRLSLRARGDMAPLEQAISLKLPVRIGQRTSKDGIEAVCLGPDEWVLVTPSPAVAGVQKALAKLYDKVPHSLTDISGREVTLVIEGPRAAELLTIGCPRDIAAIPDGEARRTVFDGVTVVLWRDAADRFRMDVWNSFAPFVAQSLETGCREFSAEGMLAG